MNGLFGWFNKDSSNEEKSRSKNKSSKSSDEIINICGHGSPPKIVTTMEIIKEDKVNFKNTENIKMNETRWSDEEWKSDSESLDIEIGNNDYKWGMNDDEEYYVIPPAPPAPPIRPVYLNVPEVPKITKQKVLEVPKITKQSVPKITKQNVLEVPHNTPVSSPITKCEIPPIDWDKVTADFGNSDASVFDNLIQTTDDLKFDDKFDFGNFDQNTFDNTFDNNWDQNNFDNNWDQTNFDNNWDHVEWPEFKWPDPEWVRSEQAEHDECEHGHHWAEGTEDYDVLQKQTETFDQWRYEQEVKQYLIL